MILLHKDVYQLLIINKRQYMWGDNTRYDFFKSVSKIADSHNIESIIPNRANTRRRLNNIIQEIKRKQEWYQNSLNE